jgi:hypothetical protein
VDEAGARTVADTIRTLYREVHSKFRDQVRGLDHGTLNWSPLPKANSIAVLVTHTLGSEREMIRALRQMPSDRDREAEFKVEAEAADLLALLDQADRELDEHIAALAAADLTEMRPRGERAPRPGIEWLASNYGHAREHLAQIELTKQLYDSRE